jgi:hypothetical protein
MAYANLTNEIYSIWESWERQKKDGFKTQCHNLSEGQIKGDSKGNITSVDMQKDCPAATRERLSMAQEIAKGNEAMLKTKTDSLMMAIDAARKAGQDTTVLEQKYRVAMEARKTNIKNMDRLESIQSDYAKKYTPGDNKYDQRAHAMHLTKMQTAMQERLAQEQAREIPDFDRIEALQRRLGRVGEAVKKSNAWLESNDTQWKKMRDEKKFDSQQPQAKPVKGGGGSPKAAGGTGGTGAVAGQTGAAPNTTGGTGAVAGQTGAAPNTTGATGAAPATTGATGAAPATTGATGAAPQAAAAGTSEAARAAAEPGTVWETKTGFGAKRKDGKVGDKRATRYFKSRDDAEKYSQLDSPTGSRRKNPDRKPVEKKPKTTPPAQTSGKPKRTKKPAPAPATAAESLAIRLVGKHLTEKWSQEYKNTINCDNPKGFSQRAHCQGKALKESDVSALAKKHKVSPKSIQKQLKMGTEVEKEHTSDEKEARKIALDHLAEVPDYYSKLKKYVEPVQETYRDSGLGKWFEGESADDTPGWDRYNTAGKRIGKCGDAEEGEAYAACLSKQKAKKLGKKGISSFVKRKRAAQKKSGMAKKGEGDAGGGDAPVRVSTGIDKISEAVEEVSMEEMLDGITTLINLIKKHEKEAHAAKRAGNKAEYQKHRGAIAEYSADIRTVKKMIRQAEEKLKSALREEAEGTEGKSLNKPFRTPGEKKKFAVYVKNDKGNVVKVRFGDPNMSIKRDDPGRLKAFRSRHSCDDDVGPKWKARYWSCQMWRSDKSVNDILDEGIGSQMYALVVDGKIVAKGSAKAMRKAAKEYGGVTPFSLRRRGKGVFIGNSPGKKVGDMWESVETPAIGEISEASENEPTNPELWSKVQDLVAGRSSSMEHGGETIEGPNGGKGFDVHPSAYSNAWASKLYKRLGGGWRKKGE